MMTYDGNQERYARLAGSGFKILVEAVEEELPYEIKCPAELICGTKDMAGSTKRYNRAWHTVFRSYGRGTGDTGSECARAFGRRYNGQDL